MLALPWKFSIPLNCIYPDKKCVLNKLNKLIISEISKLLQKPTVK